MVGDVADRRVAHDGTAHVRGRLAEKYIERAGARIGLVAALGEGAEAQRRRRARARPRG